MTLMRNDPQSLPFSDQRLEFLHAGALLQFTSEQFFEVSVRCPELTGLPEDLGLVRGIIRVFAMMSSPVFS